MKRLIILILIYSLCCITCKQSSNGAGLNYFEFIEKQQLNISDNKKYSVYTKFNPDGNQLLYANHEEKNNCVNDNIFLKFDPVVNNNGVYAYCLSEYSVADSVIYIGNSKDTEIKIDLNGLHKNLAICDNKLAFSYTQLYSDKEFLMVYDLKGEKLFGQEFLFGYIQKIQFLNDNIILVEAYNTKTLSGNIYKFDLNKNIISNFFISDNDIILKENLDGDIEVYEISGDDNSKILFNTYYYLYDCYYNNDYSNSNNYLGRLTWNEAYRILALSYIYEKTSDKYVQGMIKLSVSNIIKSLNGKNINKYNPTCSWSTKKYSINKTEFLSVLVTDFFDLFENSVFSRKDVTLISNTLDLLLAKKSVFSRFISQDINYQKPSFRFLSTIGWSNLDNDKLKKYYQTLRPLIYPKFDCLSSIFLSYVEMLNSIYLGLRINEVSLDFNCRIKKENCFFIDSFDDLNIFFKSYFTEE